jgi:hypothetical protein
MVIIFKTQLKFWKRTGPKESNQNPNKRIENSAPHVGDSRQHSRWWDLRWRALTPTILMVSADRRFNIGMVTIIEASSTTQILKYRSYTNDTENTKYDI